MWIALGVLGLLSVLFLCPLRIKLVFVSQWGEANVRISVRVLCLSFVFQFHIRLSSKFGISIYLLRKNGNAKKLFPQKKENQNKNSTVSEVLNKTRIKRLDLHCAVGVDNNPAVTAILCGSLQIFLQTACAILSARERLDVFYIQVLPVWERDIIRLKLESILEILPAKIIYIILGKGLKRKNEFNGGNKERNGTSN